MSLRDRLEEFDSEKRIMDALCERGEIYIPLEGDSEIEEVRAMERRGLIGTSYRRIEVDGDCDKFVGVTIYLASRSEGDD